MFPGRFQRARVRAQDPGDKGVPGDGGQGQPNNETTVGKTVKTKRGKNMKVNGNQRKRAQGFTLIEMIGVLAVIAILASMLIPKIFEAINSARINNTIQSYNSIKTAVLDHYGKFGAINYNGFTQAPALPAELAAYDTGVLLPEAMIDKPFRARVA